MFREFYSTVKSEISNRRLWLHLPQALAYTNFHPEIRRIVVNSNLNYALTILSPVKCVCLSNLYVSFEATWYRICKETRCMNVQMDVAKIIHSLRYGLRDPGLRVTRDKAKIIQTSKHKNPGRKNVQGNLPFQ